MSRIFGQVFKSDAMFWLLAGSELDVGQPHGRTSFLAALVAFWFQSLGHMQIHNDDADLKALILVLVRGAWTNWYQKEEGGSSCSSTSNTCLLQIYTLVTLPT